MTLFDKSQQLAAQDSPSCKVFRMHMITKRQDEDGSIHDNLEDDYAEVDPKVLTGQTTFFIDPDINPGHVT
ncbi:hypothetical protein N7G274_009263 [Stereocaulon virgatum]|uniref:Uncharacterized protein n=1 Tax=Stereocaulon virgatum TaxID=373712 RepID=A0ABR3ZZ45_9LECA